MHWGHAVSRDLVRWTELGIGLYPKRYGDWAFSGSAVVDKGNTSGWGTMEKPPLVLAYTSTGRGECVAYSTDDGRTWTEYDKNPVVKHAGRDPKLVWYEKGKHWVMAVYDESEGKKWIAFHTSPDLKAWTFASRIEGFYECPDLFPISVGVRLGDKPKPEKWVLYGADGKYLLGDFDGKAFRPDHKEKKQLWYGRFYAAQTFSDPPLRARPRHNALAQDQPAPRRVQIGWAQGVTFPGMPFNQQMTVPVDLSLLPDDDGPNLYATPLWELADLREDKPAFDNKEVLEVKGGPRTLADDLDAFEFQFGIEPGKETGFTLDLRGTKLVYDAAKGTLICKDVTAPARPEFGKLALRGFVDRGSVEVFAWNGRSVLSVAATPDEKNRKFAVTAHGGTLTVPVCRVYRMKSAWGK
jgi:fructan beta-fructosidase